MGWEPLPKHQDYFTFIEGQHFCQCKMTEFIQAAAAGKFKSQVFADDWVVHISESAETDAALEKAPTKALTAYIEVIPGDFRSAFSSDELPLKRGLILDGPHKGKYAHFPKKILLLGKVEVSRGELERYRATRSEPNNATTIPAPKDTSEVPALGEKKEQTLLRIIGTLALYISTIGDGKRHVNNGSPNASTISEDVLAKVIENELNEHGLSKSNIERHISKGVALLKK